MSLLDVLDAFNWIDRLDGVLAGVARGRWMKEYRIKRDAHPPQETEDYLKDHGVKIAGRRIMSQEAAFVASDKQDRWTKYLLKTKGTPKQPKSWAQKKREAKRAKRTRGLLDALRDLL